ncbi:MAG: purine-nucleoside phosphorylase [Candidatus Caldarchaeum sp.]|nr:purine-nucleoside phosphorylase [Candidatus Caldarchaeum sp.]MCX8200638.1 purine-nucleoside phosphorylase [Candidatus Caldarchaeum sp.]MDW8063775.1 purine-nucleoside phosphorylase [Candidatus Caldarchaeum sp.]MDW8434581.1 purine-nucleoside phosphorylase [Candidatus Caldarchaeum sp.]
MLQPQHLKTRDIAKRVVAAGDPARVVQLSKMLDSPRLVNENRGFIAYTGSFRGEPVTVICHGVGGPSSAIVFEEVAMLGAKLIIRFGTCGAFVKGMKNGEVVIPTAAAYIGGTLQQYVPDTHLTPTPSYEVVSTLVEEFKNDGLKTYVGPVFSSDAFYAEDPEFAAKWSRRGYIAVEMECATLFGLGMLRNLKTGSALLISDNLAEMTPMVDAEYLRPFVEKAGKAVLSAAVKVPLE